jgi:hypothetical protein
VNRTLRLSTAEFWLAAGLLVACGEESTGAHDVDSGSGATDAAVGSGGQGSDATTSGDACPPGSGDPSPDAICVRSVTGRFLDEAGDPVEEGLLVTACGQAQCDPGNTDANGRFDIPVNIHLVPEEYSVLAHGRPDFGAFYFQLPPESGPDVDMGDLRRLAMPSSGPSIVVDRMGSPAQSLTSGEVTLLIPDGTFVRVDVESATFGDAGKQFRALRVPDALLDEMIDPDLHAFALYGFEPFEAQFEVPVEKTLLDVRLSFENTSGLAAGARVELLALGSYVHPDWVKPAVFEPVATGSVTEDGARIELDPGEGVTYLTWVALRPL